MEIFIDDYFICSGSNLLNFFHNEKAIFGKYWNVPLKNYYVSKIPGNKEGVSASCTGGFNLIINKYISEERKKASGKVIEFFLSKEFQIRHVKKSGKFSGLDEIYYDEDLCKEYDCEPYRNLQHLIRPSSFFTNYEDYIIRFRKYFDKYIYGNADIEETLEKIDNITALHYIKLNSTIGIIVIAVTSLLIFSIAASTLLIFCDFLNINFYMFNKKFLFTVLLGLIIIASYGFLIIGKKTLLKCEIKLFCTVLGTSLVFCPIFIKELIYIPEKNKLSEFVKKKSFTCLILLVSIDFIFIISISLVSPYKIEKVLMYDSMNYEKCTIRTNYYYILYILIIIVKAIIYLSSVFLTFIEWNLEIIYREIRVISIIIYTSILLIIFLFVINSMNVKNIYYTLVIRASINFLYSFFVYMILVWSRIYYRSENVVNNNSGVRIIKQNSKKDSQVSVSTSVTTKKQSFRDKIVSFHFSSGDELFNNERLSDKKENILSSIKEQPEIVLYTGVIPFSQITDISDNTYK